MVAVWIAATLGAVAVGLFAADSFLTWLPVVLAGCALLTFVVQLALKRKEGLVTRMIASIAGAVVIIGLATLVLAVVHPAITLAV